MSEYHNEYHNEYRSEQHHEEDHERNKMATAPPQHSNNSGDDNGFYVVDDKSKNENQQNVEDVDKLVSDVADAVNSGKEDINKILDELNESQKKLAENNAKVVSMEADSSTAAATKPVFGTGIINEHSTPVLDMHMKTKESGDCPYYSMVCSHLKKMQEQIPQEVNDYILWKNPKMTGALLGGTLVLLLSLACFSFLSVVSTSAMLALAITGAYRFYLAVMFRIKGTHDETFEKLTKQDVRIPQERLHEMSRIIETDINQFLVQSKAILLWENVWVSAATFAGLYFVYCIGSVFNLFTLVILALVSVFTLPKVYQVYKKPIDQAMDKTSGLAHKVMIQVQDKLPFLKKKTLKTQ